MTILTSQINDNDRERTDLGDIEQLAESINTYGRGINRPLQPIILRRDDHKLITGGRRLSALRLLSQIELTEGIHFLYQDNLADDQLKEMELEENVRRKQMDWKEECHCIAAIHTLKKRNAILSGEEWGYRQTGELLGMSHFPVTYALMVSKTLKSGMTVISNATSLREAIDLLVQERARLTSKEEASRLKTKIASNVQEAAIPGQEPSQPGTSYEVIAPVESKQVTIPLSRQLFLGDCLEVLSTFPKASMDHCVCDPPYAIDMDNIQQSGMGMDVSATASEHVIDENLLLLENLFPKIHYVLKPTSYFILWYDLDHHNFLQNLAVKNGFKVQRWPFIWCKNSQCQNGAANVNFTKKTEVAMVLRREHAQLATPAITNYKEDSNVTDKAILGHPFVKPYSVWRMLIEAVSAEGQSILDPFAGVGSCPTSCVLLKRTPIGIEKVQTHYDRMMLNIKKSYEQQFGSEKEYLFT